jgi:cyclic beta-1,2-glucan synthetase
MVRAATQATLEPIRAEIYGTERLAQHAQALARSQRVHPRGRRRGFPLLDRFEDNARALLQAYRALADEVQKDRSISPTAEWLIDNFHIIDEQLIEIREALPSGYYRELPKLAGGPMADHPRAYGIAWAFVAHTDSRFDANLLELFLSSYQEITPLTIGELWAIPGLLRLVLIENLRRLAQGVVESRGARTRAGEVADRLLGEGSRPADAMRELEAYDERPLERTFVVEIIQRLRDSDPAANPVVAWLERRLAEEGTTAEALVRSEHASQIAAHATVANIITSMRQMASFDWPTLFESVSLVEATLRRETTETYPRMDFATRDAYRHAIEELSRGSDRTEIEIAEAVLERAAEAPVAPGVAAEDGRPARARDLGFWLVDAGRRPFEREVGYRPPIRTWLRRAYTALATPGYLGTIALLSALLLLLLLAYVSLLGVGTATVVALALIALVPATDLAIAIVHRDVTELIGPRRLPKLDMRGGVPPEYRTVVVVPTMLTSLKGVSDQLDVLERHYLANADGDLGFALLSDWRDAPTETLPDDADLLALAGDGIGRLNRLYGPAPWGGPRFMLFHRRRRWNDREGTWIGWERKRGKLHEFNRLLRGATDTSFIPREDGAGDPPADVRYVITLDADTRLGPGTAHRMVSAMAHPLNRARYDPARGRVTEGYGIIQPRITPMLPQSGERTLYHRIFAGPTGIDPYSAAVSDVYQDLFGEGIYVGKGIYDVDAFEAALEDRVPENALLSHDLFEGTWARCGLATDIELYDDFPSNYETSARRVHRWARGDWQLLPWILGAPPAVDGRRRPSSMPAINRWKMIDNLRRTLSAPATFVLLVVGWVTLPVSPLVWTGFVVATLALPAAVPVLAGFFPRRRGIAKRAHIRGVVLDALEAGARVGLALVFLPNRAVLMTDAIVRTLWRLIVSRRKLLEWVPAALAGKGSMHDLPSAYRSMWRGVLLGLAAAAVALVVRPETFHLAFPMLALWLASPAVALWLSHPIEEAPAESLEPEEVKGLAIIARLTWRYFETLVSEATHWLPPDNIQVDPDPVIALRTSPTNIGVYLLSVVAARDFAWIGSTEMAERIESALDTIDRLDLFHGHLYNWYDVDRLEPLEPRYVSTVDSGNLAGHLLAMAEALREPTSGPSPLGAILTGIDHAMALAEEASIGAAASARQGPVTRREVDATLARVHEALSGVPIDRAGRFAPLIELEQAAADLVDVAEVFSEDSSVEAARDFLYWANAVRNSVRSHLRDKRALAPWATLLAAPPPASAQSTEGFSEGLHRLQAGLERGALDEARAELATLRALAEPGQGSDDGDLLHWLGRVTDAVAEGERAARNHRKRTLSLADRAQRLFEEMDFAFLYDLSRKLFPIGFRISDGHYDSGYYDLLASEARQVSLVAIAKGDVPVEHWFRLGRPATPLGRDAALLSWSGSMFEYLMPCLVMQAPPDTLLDRTQRLVVQRQIRYGAERGVPWGISESAYNARDFELTYQYSHFGIPGLGLTRGLSEDLVVAPYATALAAMFAPRSAIRNFQRLAAEGARGSLGYYEAIDYTPERVPQGSRSAVVRAYMAHHQGMTILSLANVLLDDVMQRRFHRVPIVGANDLLLQERVPRDVAVQRPRAEEVHAVRHVREVTPPVERRFRTPHERTPRTHVLSNGRYNVMMTNAGAGYSRWRDLAVTRWREDATRDHWGTFVYVRDVTTGHTWSAGYQPTTVVPDSYEAAFMEDRIEIRRRDAALATTVDVIVSPEDDGELRRVSIKNLGSREHVVELTSYAEVALDTPAADAAHPVFQNLFVQTEYLSTYGALLATRRPRASDVTPVWAVHVAAVEGKSVEAVQYETDRARFLDRGVGFGTPSTIVDGRPLSNTTGAVLDPIFSLRRLVRLRPGETVVVTFSTLVADSREKAVALADKYHDPATFEREAALAWTQAQVLLHHLGISANEAHMFQRLAGRILYLDPTLRPPTSVLARMDRGQRALWRYGISGDLPIVLARIDQIRDREIVRQLLRAHEYWGWKGLAVDLVVLNEHEFSYSDELQDWLERIVRVTQSRTVHDSHTGHGTVFILRGDQLPPEDRDLIHATARVVLLSHHGSLAEQLETSLRDQAYVAAPSRPEPEAPPPRLHLSFFNGLGGFADDGREYVTVLGEGQWTPAPWVNVVANPDFGFTVSESGSGFTWAVNSRENRLTPWSNDPVNDPPGEVLYVRDEDAGIVWTPTPLPIREATPYVTRHGQGYSRFEHQSHGIALELVQFVPPEDPIKISRLVIRNLSDRSRRLTVTAYAEWVLGVLRENSAPFIWTEIDEPTQAVFAHNRWSEEFGARVAFADLRGKQKSWTTDRGEFLGRNGNLEYPAGMEPGSALSGAVGGGFDPCAALRQPVTVPAGGTVEVVFLLGQGADGEEARRLVSEYRTADLDATLATVQSMWDDVLGALKVSTPDESMTIMLNRWLLYQTLSCRVWARSAFYQSGGAYGFRDQLQDVTALIVARRETTREHLLRCAARQFVEGDVQHWWHAPSGRGVRTRFSDDRAWLPFALVHYLEVTGDDDVLDEEIPFLEGMPLAEGESERYFEPRVTSETATLYEHCARAIDVSLGVGPHGLPLMGSGDWNDGMNRVGDEGQGESVWLAWFLHLTIGRFLPVAERRADDERVARWRDWLASTDEAVERHGWDGHWYRRAFFDDGTPLGSNTSQECKIDSIAQSWGVISGAAPRERAEQAMRAVEQYLVRRGDGLVLLFTPPFDDWDVDPGYIKGYLPGVRENGGQYTHGALWSVIAFAELGEGDKAAELFSILNPINQASTRAGIYRYKVEPYAAVADVYSEPPHLGRGGWTWYTGSAGWMYRAGIEWILGFRLRGEVLHLDPCIPRDWPGFRISFAYHSARYNIDVANPSGVMRGIQRVVIDGREMTRAGSLATPRALGADAPDPAGAGASSEESGSGARIPLVDDGRTHQIKVTLGVEKRPLPREAGG